MAYRNASNSDTPERDESLHAEALAVLGFEATCELCSEPIRQYVHSKVGPIEAKAWTTTPEDSESDPRYGTVCDSADRWPLRHRPEGWEDDA